MAVLDSQLGSVTVFEPTEYADAIHKGLAAQNELDYDAAYGYWEEVLSMNNNFELAKSEVGKVYLANGEYKKAMQQFKESNNTAQYSRALAEYRTQLIYDNIYWIVGGLVIIFAATVLIVMLRRRRRAGKM